MAVVSHSVCCWWNLVCCHRQSQSDTCSWKCQCRAPWSCPTACPGIGRSSSCPTASTDVGISFSGVARAFPDERIYSKIGKLKDIYVLALPAQECEAGYGLVFPQPGMMLDVVTQSELMYEVPPITPQPVKVLIADAMSVPQSMKKTSTMLTLSDL